MASGRSSRCRPTAQAAGASLPRLSAQEPAWAPDGRHIAFMKQKLDQASIAIVRSDGRGNIRQLTGKPLFPAKPAWSPDGESIVFSGTKGQASG